MYIGIGQASRLLGVSVTTIRRWDRSRKFSADRRKPWKPAFKIHANCGGKLDRKKNWHYPPCSKCKAEVNSHENAAKMLVKYYLSSSTIQQFLSSLTWRKS